MKKAIKKLLRLLLTAAVAATVNTAVIALAAETTTTPSPGPAVEDLFRPFQYTNQGTQQSKIGIVSNIAQRTGGDWTKILGGVIQFILGITGSLAFISFTVGGLMMVTARGNEDQIKKGKDILTWSVIALAIIATSYAIVLGVSQLRF